LNSVESADPQATIAMLRRALERMPGNADAMIGLAGMHLRLGMLDAAADWCDRASAASPGAAIGRVRAAIGEAYVNRGLREVIDGRLGDAIATLSRATDLTGDAAARLYRDLFLQATSWFDDAARLAPEGAAIRLSLPVWGAGYVAAATSGLLRSLLAPGNLPSLAATRTVRLEITTSAEGRALLESAPVLAALRRHAAIDYFIIPDHVLARPAPPGFTYWVMSVAHHASTARARSTGSSVSFLTADMLMSDGSLRAAQRLVDDGAQAVLVSALEADHAALVGDADEGALALAPGELVRHGLARLGVAAGPAPVRALTSSSFAIDGGVATYGFHFLPLLVSPALLRRDVAFDLLSVDTRFVRLALGDDVPAGRVKVVCDAGEIAVVSTLRAAPEAAAPPAQDAEALGRWAAGWCFAPADIAWFEWCFGHRIVHRLGGAAADAGPGELERATVAGVLGAYRRHAALRLAERRA
jgi:Tetratricopeptide repeat